MKLYISLCTVVLLVNLSYAQDNFTVIKVTGKVLSQKNSKVLISGDKIQSKDALQFASRDSFIILYSPKTGKKMIKGVPDNSPREFMELLQSYTKSAESVSARSAGLKYIDMLEHMLSHDTILILGDGRILVETDKLKMEKPSGFRAIYRSGNATVQRKISDSNSFSLSRLSLFGEDAPSQMPQVSIQYYLDEAEEFAFADGKMIGKFVPVYVEDDQLKTEIRCLIGAFEPNISNPDWHKEVRDYLTLAYGGTIDDNLRNWLGSNKLVK